MAAGQDTPYKVLATPKLPANLHVPLSDATVKVSIIDTTSYIALPVDLMVKPTVGNFKEMTCPSYSFLVQHASSGKNLLFDLGVRRDWGNLAPALAGRIKAAGWTIRVERDVREILEGNGVEVAGGAISEIIWSHYHWDHTGDPSRFPASTALVVGPGFKERFPRAATWPSKEDSPLREDMWSGRELREVSAGQFGDSGIKIGRFRAVDWFGDGSFYLLDTPGHLLGHICGLARTTAGPDSFILMGGDAAHHGGELRPSEYLPLPQSISLDCAPKTASFPSVCPGEVLLKLHPDKSATKPYYSAADGFNENKEVAEWTIDGLIEFDGNDNVLVVIAHDHTLLDVLDLYPKPADDWKAKSLQYKGRWRFHADFRSGLKEAGSS